MKGMIKAVLNKPVTVVVTILALVVFFITSMSSITLKLMPDMSIPIMAVITVYPGAAPEEVDELVSDKISNACESLTGIKNIQCQSRESSSMVMLQYEYGTDMDKAYNDVRAAVDGVKSSLPSDAKDPTILEVDTNSIEDITLSITGASDDVDVLTEVNEVVIPELKKVSTLAQTTVNGGDEKYIRVQVKPEYMEQYGLSLTSIATAIGAANFSMPAGTASYGDQAISMAAEVKYDTIPKLEQVPITTSKGQVIHLNDVATVKYAVSDKTSLSRYEGKENVSVGIKRKQSASSVTLSRQVKPVLERLRANYPNLKIDVVEDMADTIIDTLKGVAKTMVQAVLLAMIIIFVFFGDIKGSLIVGSTMPISIMATIICMKLAGFALDIITMGALIIAIGMMTDNAVVVIEMCFRRHQAGLSFKEAAYEGTAIVVNAVIGSTITTVVVYLPLAMMEGLSGQMFKPLGSTIIFALLASLISAITLIPLCFASYKPVERKDIITNRILRRLSKFYRKVLRFALKWKKSVFFAAIGILVFTLFLASFLKTELFSGTDEGIVQVSVNFRPNLEIEAMDDTVKEVEKFVEDSGLMKNYSTSISRTNSNATISAYTADDIELTTREIVDKWNTELANFAPICKIQVSEGSTTGMSQLSAANTKEFDITCNNYDELKATSQKLIKIMEETDGVLYVTSNFNNSGTQARVIIDPVLASAKGFSAKQLAGLVYNNMSGAKGTDVTIDNKKYEVNVKYPEGYFEKISDVESMTFTNTSGVPVPLSEVGKVSFESAPLSVMRQDGLFVDQLKATMTSSTIDQVTPVLDEKVKAMVDADEDISFLDDLQTRMMNEEFASIGTAIFIALFLVFFVMTVQFESIADSILIMMCVPFAGIGSILFMLIAGIKVSMVSLMGVLMLSGIVVNNGIILIDMTIQNQRAGMNTVEALVDAGSGRLRPILMTTLTTVIAMIPVSMGWSKDAMAMQGMAAVIVGGLTASTVLTLVLLPTFYLLLDRFKAKSAEAREKRKLKLEQRVAEQESILKEKRREESKVNLVFLMGGAGTRFFDNGFECPKPLIELNGEPFFKRAADSLIGHVNYEKLIFVVLKEHADKFAIDKKILEYYPDAKIVLLLKVLPGAVMTALEGVKRIKNDLPVIFTDCDLMFRSEAMYDYYTGGEYDAAGTLITFTSDQDKYSYVRIDSDESFDDNGYAYAVETAEKKVISEHAITGCYGFANVGEFVEVAKKYLDNCPYNEYFMSGLYNEVISSGRKIKVFSVDDYHSFGTPEEYKEATEALIKIEGKREKAEKAEDKNIEADDMNNRSDAGNVKSDDKSSKTGDKNSKSDNKNLKPDDKTEKSPDRSDGKQSASEKSASEKSAAEKTAAEKTAAEKKDK
ncbi:MAG: efflux RND transporter permease subunit [Lachnospiraceae bacterium]|nr:efflux RND transporter permease subunit [Lachnospiraceae bacterium]